MTENTSPRLTRADIQAQYGYSAMTLKRWWAERATNGHPAALRDGRTLTWDAAEWEAWDRQRQQDVVGGAEFARMLGHRDNSWVSKAAVTPPPGFPEPVEWGDPTARRRPKWRREDAQRFADNRTGTRPPAGAGRPLGARTGTAYADDPRLILAIQVLADHPDERAARHIERLQGLMPGSSASTWTKILKAAREHQEQQ
ncbi:hypothetical protein [Streptomyces sp. NPDC012746]|uniref:hypothetical protein n=1 Tax=Streptomyces sp. NPDC012746 TaxID=3364845 RepID=UPI0036BABB06